MVEQEEEDNDVTRKRISALRNQVGHWEVAGGVGLHEGSQHGGGGRLRLLLLPASVL